MKSEEKNPQIIESLEDFLEEMSKRDLEFLEMWKRNNPHRRCDTPDQEFFAFQEERKAKMEKEKK